MAQFQMSICLFLMAASVFVSLVMAKRSTPKPSGSRRQLNMKFTLANHHPNRPDVITLSEEMPRHSLIGLLEISAPVKGQVTCTFDNPYISAWTLGTPMTFRIELSENLDRETKSEIIAKFECKDQDTPVPASATRSFTVSVADENDNPPVFSEEIYIANVTEGASIGEIVLNVKATDADADENGQFEYSLSGLDIYGYTPFAIDPVSGQISTLLKIDREAHANFTFTVVATDKGEPSNVGKAVVVVHVDDVNDNAPVIMNKELRIRENQAANTLVGKIIAADVDSGKNAELVFTKVESDDSSSTAPFEVKQNGNVFSIVPLDREQKSEYAMAVMVKDKGSPRLSSTATIVVTVDDANDNSPEITSPCLSADDSQVVSDLSYLLENETNSSGQSGFITVDWYMPSKESFINKVTAVDIDSGENSRLVYGIENVLKGDNLSDLFTVDQSMGTLNLNRPLSLNDSLVQLVNISVTDSGHPSRASYCLLNVTFDVDLSFLLRPAEPQETEITSINSASSATFHRTLVFVHLALVNFAFTVKYWFFELHYL